MMNARPFTENKIFFGKLFLFTPIALLLFAMPAHAYSEEATSRGPLLSGPAPQLSGNARISFLAGADVTTPQISTSHLPGFNGSVLVDFGRGLFSLETGIESLSEPVTFSSPASASLSAGAIRQSTSLNYVGIPLVAKYNYIERPLNAFSFKLGGLQTVLLNADDALYPSLTPTYINDKQSPVTLNRQMTFGLAGFTGTAAISKSIAFVIDATYLYGITKPIQAAPPCRGSF